MILVGNLLWIFTGIVAASGPTAGASGSVVSRAMYGAVGNKVVFVLTGWLIADAYVALNWPAASVVGIGLAGRFGLPDDSVTDAVVICVIAGGRLFIAIFGYATIVRLSTCPSRAGVTAVPGVSLTGGEPVDVARHPTEPSQGQESAGMNHSRPHPAPGAGAKRPVRRIGKVDGERVGRLLSVADRPVARVTV